jgi:hypothetical protein
MTVFLRVNSHRAGHKLDQALGRHPDYFYTFHHGGCFAEVTQEEYAVARAIKGRLPCLWGFYSAPNS